MEQSKSKRYFEEASKVLVGGVNSPVRSFSSIARTPIVASSAKGAYLIDLDGNSYIDYIGSWGPMILGYQHEAIMNQVEAVMKQGISFGLSHPSEKELAECMIDAYPALQKVRFVTSGTEATMSAIRCARGYTKKTKVIKFAGCYHGHHDGMLVEAGSGAATFSQPNSLGVPASMIQDTLVATYNDIASVKNLLARYPGDIAAVILEPIAANMGVIKATSSFLHALRELCNEHEIVLIFDEVITGFRICYGGASAYYGIQPDLACFGKIIGAGMSVGAYGGKAEIMDMIAPIGGVYQAGTLAGNPLAMHLGIQQLTYLKEHPEVYEHLEQYGKALEDGIQKIINRLQIRAQIQRAGSLLTIFFADKEICSDKDLACCRKEDYAVFTNALLDAGVLCAPSQYEAMFISYAHGKTEFEKTMQAMEHAFMVVKNAC